MCLDDARAILPRRRMVRAGAIAVFLLFAAPAFGQTATGPQTSHPPIAQPFAAAANTTLGSVTGLPLPRFGSLRTDDVNLRAGPGLRYPVLWVYHRRFLPVEIIREFDVWRLVIMPDGQKGWMHEATLVGRRTLVVTGTVHALRADANPKARVVANLAPGVIGDIEHCAAGAAWCRVRVGDYRGWLSRSDFWGTLAGEAVN